MFSNYGHKSNEELILGYGFVLPDNKADFFHISLGIVPQAEGKALKMLQNILSIPSAAPGVISYFNHEDPSG